VSGAENRDGLVDDMILVRLEMFSPALLNELHHPAGVEVDAETNPAAMLREMFDCEPQPARSARAEHQPIGSPGKLVVGKCLAEQLVVGSKILDVDARLRHAGGSAGLENVDRFVGECFRHKPAHRSAAKPLILEQAEFLQIGKPGNVLQRIERELPGALEPEGATGCRIEVPLHDFAHVLVQPLASGPGSSV
jgi:hypothetical protein